jgi:hypothetical protein
MNRETKIDAVWVAIALGIAGSIVWLGSMLW